MGGRQGFPFFKFIPPLGNMNLFGYAVINYELRITNYDS